jgi:spore germination protein YaaH
VARLGRLLLVAVLLLPGSPARAAPAERLMLGYYVPYDATSWASLQAHADAIDVVAVQWVSVDACGNLGSADDQTLKQFARSRGLKVVPSLFTLSGWLNHQLLTNDDVAQRLLDQIVEYTLVEDYDGFDLDLEGVDAADRDALSSFVGRLGEALHERGKLLTLAVPAKERDVVVGWAGPYDYAVLGAAADLVTIMAYEYRGPFSGPGSVAPYDWVERVLAFATRQIAADKVLLGVAFYGYDWNTTSGETRSVGYPQALSLAEQYGAEVGFDDIAQSATFSYEALAGERTPNTPTVARVAHQITVRAPPPCDVTPPAPTPLPSRARPPQPGTVQAHEVWVEDHQSAVARLGLADRYAAGGVATWRLGLEDPRVWTAIQSWRGTVV